MGLKEKTFATAIIWTALALIMIFAEEVSSNFISIGILALAAVICTAAVWDALNSHPSKSENSATHAENSEKAKRREDERLTRLIASMNEEDLATLEALLASRRDQLDEDEQIELSRLLAEQERTRH